MQNDKMTVCLLTSVAAGHLAFWFDWFNADGRKNAFMSGFQPGPEHFVSLANYADVFCMTDEIVLTNGPESCARVVLDRDKWGHCRARGVLERLLSDPCWEIDRVCERGCRETVDVYRAYEQIENAFPFAMTANNYLAWEYVAATLPLSMERFRDQNELSLPDAIPVYGTGSTLARVIIESSRKTMIPNDVVLYPTTALEIDEIRLPLVLPSVIRKIDRRDQFFEAVSEMKQQLRTARTKLRELERALTCPSIAVCARDLTLLRNDLVNEVDKMLPDCVTAPARFELVEGLESIDDCDRIPAPEGLRDQLHRLFADPEIRLLTCWPSSVVESTVLRIRELFDPKGTDTEWRLVNRMMQLPGIVSWHPFRKMIG